MKIIIKEIGSCIYCGSTGPGLTDEHIMPFALGGNAVLAKASCSACQLATSKIELHVCRPIAGMMRARLGIQTRRPDKRTTVPQTFFIDDKAHTIPFATDHFPAILSYPSFAPPGILAGRAPEGQYRSTGIYSLGADSDFTGMADAALAKAGATKVQLASFLPTRLMNFMAKVSHAAAIALLDPATFDPMLRVAATTEGAFDYLLGNSQSFPPQKGVRHALELFQDTGRSGSLLIARLRWFADLKPPMSQLSPGEPILAPPPFLAVVGRPTGMVLAHNQRAYINWMLDGRTEYGIAELPDNWRSLAKPIPIKR